MTLNECPMCGGKIVLKKEQQHFKGFKLGVFEFEECIECGEQFFFNDMMIAIEELEHQLVNLFIFTADTAWITVEMKKDEPDYSIETIDNVHDDINDDDFIPYIRTDAGSSNEHEKRDWRKLWGISTI